MSALPVTVQLSDATKDAAPQHCTEGGTHSEGTVLWFEYHCWEDPRSADAPAWYRSHQQVTVLALCMNDSAGMSAAERADQGMPFTYRIRFNDGLEWDVFEDELSTTQERWYRPDPPTPRPPALTD